MTLISAERREGNTPKFFSIEHPTPAQIRRAIKTFPILPHRWNADLVYHNPFFQRQDGWDYIGAIDSAGVIPFVRAIYRFNDRKDNFEQATIMKDNPLIFHGVE